MLKNNPAVNSTSAVVLALFSALGLYNADSALQSALASDGRRFLTISLILKEF